MGTCTKVVDFGPQCGRGLVSTYAITAGETLFSEEPLLCCQFSWNCHCGYLACDHCLQPLESAEMNAKRLCGDVGLTLPYQAITNNGKEFGVNKCFCPGCGVAYCSPECYANAAPLYHSVLCTKGSTGENSLTKLDELWRQLHYPPETSTIFLLVRIVAAHFSAHLFKNNQAEDIINSLNTFVSSTVANYGDDSGSELPSTISHKLLRPEFSTSVDQLHQAFIAVLFHLVCVHFEQPASIAEDTFASYLRLVGVDSLLDPNSFRCAICLLGRNGQGIATSSFSVWVKTAEELIKSTGDVVAHAKFEEEVGRLYKAMDVHVGTFLDNEGVGLYKHQSLLNHSCQPNAEVRFSGADNRLSVVALEDIAQGQEVTVSYLDACQLARSRHSRRRELAQNYLFWCTCARCRNEYLPSDLVSETSSSEEEDEESGLSSGEDNAAAGHTGMAMDEV